MTERWWEGPELREPLVLQSKLAEAWAEGAEYMAAQEGILPDLDANPYLVTP